MPKKSFVLDTNVLIHNPNARNVFADNEVVIPMTVVEELDNFKHGNDDKARHAESNPSSREEDNRRPNRTDKPSCKCSGHPPSNGGRVTLLALAAHQEYNWPPLRIAATGYY